MAKPTPEPPTTLPFNISALPKLDAKQAGHLRHFHNVATTKDGDWPNMGTLDPEQAFVDAYRYQLATMAYAAGITHYHRLPALPSPFKTLMRQLIKKMLLPHVWNYWYLTSQSGILVDPDIQELRKPWADPIVRENIMYSGHLLLMVSMYAMLFDDDEFEREESLVFEWKPMWWGMGPERFVYDTRSLQEAILGEMEREGWVGVCCEPNLVLVVCNQFPIIAMRYNDIRNGTNIADEVLSKYWPAIQAKHMIADDGMIVEGLNVKRSNPLAARSIAFTAWAGAHMNTWNSAWVKTNFPRQVIGHLTTINGHTRIQAPPIANEIRRLVGETGASPNDSATLDTAKSAVLDATINGSAFQRPLFGYVAEWLSELGKEMELQSLLEGIDAKNTAVWEHGGLRYAREDTIIDSEGEWVRMDPFSGNAGIGYARLNVPDGQKMMWERPRPRGYFDDRPFVDGIELGQQVDCLRGRWIEEHSAIVVTLKALDTAKDVSVQFSVKNLGCGWWYVYKKNKLVDKVELDRGGVVELHHSFASGEEVDFMVIQGSKQAP